MTRSSLRTPLALALAFALLVTLPGAAAVALGQDTWEVWPKGRGPATEKGEAVDEAAAKAAAEAGEEGGKKTAAGISTGTVLKWVAVGVGIIAVGVAIGAGGGGGGTTTTPNH